MLSIFEDMESKGIMPNRLSFSYVLDVMSDSGDLSCLSNILNIIRDRKIQPRGRSLRRVAYVAADLDLIDLVDEIKSIMLYPVTGTGNFATSRKLPPVPLLYCFEKTLKRKARGIGKIIVKQLPEDRSINS